MWERGLKLPFRYEPVGSVESLPMWERGLKHNNLCGMVAGV